MANTYQKYLFVTVYLRCVGGEVGATSSLAPKIGPLGLVSIQIISFASILKWGAKNSLLKNIMPKSLYSRKFNAVGRVYHAHALWYAVASFYLNTS